MKRIIACIFALQFFLTSCNSNEKEISSHEKSDSIKSLDTITNIDIASKYLCPMDCENGKTYADAGKCPICEMDLEIK